MADELLEADLILINVGGRALELPGLEFVPYLTNSSMVVVDYLPDHLIVVGGSYVRLEFGQMFRRFGSRVTIVEKCARKLLKQRDHDGPKGQNP